MTILSEFQTVLNFPTYLNTYLFLKGSQHWKKERWEHYQLGQLQRLLLHSYKNVPYYTTLFDEHRLHPTDITSLQDLRKIPFLTKDLVRKNIESLKATNYPQPLQFYVEKGKYFARMLAYGTIQNQWTNQHFFEKHIIILGQKEPWRYGRLGRTLNVSSFNMNEKDLPSLVQKMIAFHPAHLLSYPSSLTRLAFYMKNNALSFTPALQNIVSIAETLYPWQRTLIEDTFHCHIYEQYCQRESVAFGLSCSHSNSFHLFPQFSIVELLGKDGTPIQNEDETGEIIGTSLHSFIFPFIRYKTGDIGVYTSKPCPCGCHYPLLKRIEGRTQEFTLAKNNQTFSVTGMYDFVAKSTSHIQECQFYQDTPGVLLLHIVKTPKYTETDTQNIQKNFQKLFGDRLELTIDFVDHIPLSRNGKYQLLIQKLPIESLP